MGYKIHLADYDMSTVWLHGDFTHSAQRGSDAMK